MWTYNDSGELYHYGVLGMKWGVRRYQNSNGSLTSAGKKRISKKYKKAADRVTEDLNRNSNRIRIDSYNRAADRMNRGGIDKFNARQRKKYGDDFAKREGYEDDYQKAFDREFAKSFNKTLKDFYDNNENYQKSKALVDKYDMTKWDDLAKKNEAVIEELRQIVEKNR